MSAKDKKKGALVPRLRFPEFRDAGEWEGTTIGKICKCYSGGTPNTTHKEFYGGNIPFIRSAEIGKNSTELFLSELGVRYSSAKLVKRGAILVALYGANSGEVAISPIEGVINQAILCLESDQNNVFLYYSILNIQQFIIVKYIQGGQGNLSAEIIKSIQLYLPNIPEQQRIADCLSSLDERISAESSKLDTLKDHKKGLLKQLFPAEGETLPRLRFPEFRDAGEWEEKIISDVCSISTGKSNTEDKNDDGNFPFYVRSPIIERSTKYLYDEEAILTVGDGVGTGKVYHYVKGKYDLHQRVYRLFRFLNIDGKFLFYLFSTFFYYRVSKMSAKNSVDSVRMDMIAKMPIFVPTLAEQQRITDCLSSIDELITAQTQKIDLLKEHKKGLMQQLFPVIDEAKA